MFNILRYIKLRQYVLRTVRANGAARCTLLTQERLESQVKDLAWLAVKYGYGTPVISFKVRGHFTKRKKLIRYAEIKGEMLCPDNKKATFTMSNPFPFPFRMVIKISNNGKSSVTIQGNIHYCFEMLETLRK